METFSRKIIRGAKISSTKNLVEIIILKKKIEEASQIYRVPGPGPSAEGYDFLKLK